MTTQAEQRIDLTGHGDHLRYVEILTDAGIIRVNVNLEDTRTRQPAVVVEIEPNGEYFQRTPAGGVWHLSTNQGPMPARTDIRLVRRSQEVAQ